MRILVGKHRAVVVVVVELHTKLLASERILAKVKEAGVPALETQKLAHSTMRYQRQQQEATNIRRRTSFRQ